MSPEPIAENASLPAVSDVNGKWELGLGYLSDPGSAFIHAGGSLSVPVGHDFGLQVDLGVNAGDGYNAFGGAIHAFTRDPSRYLLGVTAGIVRLDDATLGAVGPEGEIYFDRFSLEGWAGLAGVDWDSSAFNDKTGFFGIGDIAFYPTDDWRLSIGASTVLGYQQLRLGTEYQFMPGMSFAGDARIGDDGNVIATIGLHGYFGGDGSDKTLIDRQRQDDPRPKPFDLFAAAAGLTPGDQGPPEDPEQACLDLGYPYYWDGESCQVYINN